MYFGYISCHTNPTIRPNPRFVPCLHPNFHAGNSSRKQHDHLNIKTAMVTTRRSNKRAAAEAVAVVDEAEVKRLRIESIDGQQAACGARSSAAAAAISDGQQAGAGAGPSAAATGRRAGAKRSGIHAADSKWAGLAAVAAAAVVPRGGPRSRLDDVVVAPELRRMEDNGADGTSRADLAAPAAVANSGCARRPASRMDDVLIAAEIKLVDTSDDGVAGLGPAASGPAPTRPRPRATETRQATTTPATGAGRKKRSAPTHPRAKAARKPRTANPAAGAVGAKKTPASARPRARTTRKPRTAQRATGAVLPRAREPKQAGARLLPRVPAFQAADAAEEREIQWAASSLNMLRHGVDRDREALNLDVVDDVGVEEPEAPRVSEEVAKFLEKQRVVWAENAEQTRRDRALIRASVEGPGEEAHARLERDMRAAGAPEEKIQAEKETLNHRVQHWQRAQFLAACGGRATPPKSAGAVESEGTPAAAGAGAGAGGMGPMGGLFDASVRSKGNKDQK